jgi:hypothetical protein
LVDRGFSRVANLEIKMSSTNNKNTALVMFAVIAAFGLVLATGQSMHMLMAMTQLAIT